MGTHQFHVATSRTAARALNAARILGLIEGCELLTMPERKPLDPWESPV